ncbi:MAG TPA: class I SAM-dependent rRNA methyltransferase [Planctomycetes bacterium]|nr:class I SAM-dependent rRNA methyltransferase [Planctomycetota bacterium]
MGQITVTGRGRRRLLRGHPWIYADDVNSGEGEPGELLPVFAPEGGPLGWGLFSSESKICVRLVTRSAKQPDRGFWLERVRAAVELRAGEGLLEPEGACRLIAADADGIPGLVVDRYADVLVLQSGGQASDRMMAFLEELVLEVLPFEIRAILDRSESSVRKHEGLDPRVEWRRGSAPTERIEVVEQGPGMERLVYGVDVEHGHKTGHYLDQRMNRAEAARYARGKRVLDVFSYDGLFAIRAALAGASEVVAIDQSEAAGERLLENARCNGVADRVRFERAKAMDDLRRRVEDGESWDVVVLDPPAFARSKREVDGAVRGYRELNRRGMSLVSPGGLVVSASCSHNVDRQTFTKALADGARAAGPDSEAAGREARIVRFTGASPDHPVLANLPETDYLKCAFVRVGR